MINLLYQFFLFKLILLKSLNQNLFFNYFLNKGKWYPRIITILTLINTRTYLLEEMYCPLVKYIHFYCSNYQYCNFIVLSQFKIILINFAQDYNFLFCFTTNYTTSNDKKNIQLAFKFDMILMMYIYLFVNSVN